jgi:thiol-disulfide isomerase/thioredoxin
LAQQERLINALSKTAFARVTCGEADSSFEISGNGDFEAMAVRSTIKEFAMRLTQILPATLLLAGLAVVAPACWAAPAAAPFTQPAFAATQKEGKPILVEITAPWCPVCAKQRPILSQLLSDPAFKDLVVYNIDFRLAEGRRPRHGREDAEHADRVQR